MQAQLQAQQLMNDIKAAEAKGEQLNAQALKTRVESLYVAMQAAQVVATVPGVTNVADALLTSAGFVDKHPAAGAGPTGIDQVPPVQPVAPAAAGGMPGEPQPQLGDGAATGIETPAADGIVQQ
jgi:hypothetical protein